MPQLGSHVQSPRARFKASASQRWPLPDAGSRPWRCWWRHLRSQRAKDPLIEYSLTQNQGPREAIDLLEIRVFYGMFRDSGLMLHRPM